MDLVDDLCREDRVRDVFQPRIHDASDYTEWNDAECKVIRFGGRSFVAFESNLTDVETWLHEFTEHSVYYMIKCSFDGFTPEWPKLIFYRHVNGGFSATVWHLLAALTTSGIGDGSKRLSPDEYWAYLKSSRVQSRLTEFIKMEAER